MCGVVDAGCSLAKLCVVDKATCWAPGGGERVRLACLVGGTRGRSQSATHEGLQILTKTPDTVVGRKRPCTRRRTPPRQSRAIGRPGRGGGSLTLTERRRQEQTIVSRRRSLPRHSSTTRQRASPSERTRGGSASTATRGSSTSAWCALGPSATSTRAVAPRRVKAAKHTDQDNFIPFILETGGRVNKAGRDWLDTLTASEPGEQVPSQDDHPTTTETGLREAMQALVRVQAHMLARIVVGDPLCRPRCPYTLACTKNIVSKNVCAVVV
jgi:hypothetical protein